jgi:chromosome segregation ATPase
MNIFYAVVDAVKDNVRAFSNRKKHHNPVQEKPEDATIPATDEVVEIVDSSLLASELEEKEILITKNLEKIKKLKEAKTALETKYQGLNEKYSKLTTDFSETAKRNDILDKDLTEAKEQLRQEKEKVVAFQGSIDDNDKMITEMSKAKKQAEDALTLAQTELKKLKKVAPETA